MHDSGMKFEIVLMYYDRPNMVRFALDSIAAQDYDNFWVSIIDDGSQSPIEPIVEKYPFIDKVSIWQTGDSIDQKHAQGGSRFGEQVNKALELSDADVAMMLCDDDALLPSTLTGLYQYYTVHPEVTYSYGHVLTFDPMQPANYQSIKGRYGHQLNSYNQPINAFCRVDASQVSWRLKPYIEAGITFPHPQTAALDAVVYQQMYDRLGPCVFNELVVQYKGIFPDQLGLRKDPFNPIDKEFYDSSV